MTLQRLVQRNWICAMQVFSFVVTISGEANEVDQRIHLVGVTSLFILHFQIFRALDKRMFRSVWDLYKKVPCVHLLGNVVWFGNEFLLTRLPSAGQQLLDRKTQLAAQQQQVQWLQTKNQGLTR